ncbi:MAG TPA: protealysin inhibitor emfourin [Microlunatus sp.]|nr:protealysin inhibitor emfourin [Microlunatus sp.]
MKTDASPRSDRGAWTGCAFVPPYLLRHLSTSDDETAQASGRSTLATDAALRAQRATPHQPLLVPRPAEAGADNRVVSTAGNTETLPGRQVRADGDPPSGDAAVDEAWDSSGQTLALFAEQFQRDSIDGRGGTVSITVHYGDTYDNAFWDGSRLVFGDGDGVVFGRFTKPMDVMAHEFTHGVTQYTAGLTYQGQSGALNESVSDVFASMAKQRADGETAAGADWLIGEGLFLPSINATALRSMKDPGTAYDDPQIGKDPQVGSMDDYVDTQEDNGGVHINSGIPNRAFALAAIALGGHSWERAGQIWYATLTGGDVGAGTDFAGFAQATVAAAGRLYPDDVTVAETVREAWAQVKVLTPTAPDVPVDATGSGGSVTGGSATGGSGPRRSGRGDSGAPEAPTGLTTVAVRRTGGFANVTRMAELDLDADPSGPEVRQLLMSTDLRQLVTTDRSGADRFTYTLEYGSVRVTVPEHDLTPELHRVVRLVLGENGASEQ